MNSASPHGPDDITKCHAAHTFGMGRLRRVAHRQRMRAALLERSAPKRAPLIQHLGESLRIVTSIHVGKSVAENLPINKGEFRPKKARNAGYACGRFYLTL